MAADDNAANDPLIAYIDPTSAILDELGTDVPASAAVMTFEGEAAYTPAAAAAEAAAPTPFLASSVAAPSAGLSPWLIVAVIVIAVLVFNGKD